MLLKTARPCDTMPLGKEDYSCKVVLDSINKEFGAPSRNRMLGLLLEHQTLDTWMTYQLMQEAVKWVVDKQPLGMLLTYEEANHTRDQQSSTSACLLQLTGQPVDSFYNFQSIRVDGNTGKPAVRNQNRPDGVFLMQIVKHMSLAEDMVIFYEGDVHGKDENKDNETGCKNSHKMYQAFAQAQSKNPAMAGCAIFAAMQYSPIPNITDFLDDMLKAHIFVCIAIADWNQYNSTNKDRKCTMIGNLFGEKNSLKTDIQYDFVFGINIGLEAFPAGFNDVEYTHRITTMLQRLRKHGCNIELNDGLKHVAEFKKISHTIGCVKIVVCAIPRANDDVLNTIQGQPQAMFIYPLNIVRIVTFQNSDTATLDKKCVDRLLTITGNINGNYKFKKHMMRKTSVYTNNNVVLEPHACLLSETTGFFYVALPLAYYTIQQFEFVNAALNYMWSPTRFDFRVLLRDFKAMKKHLTGDVNVTMFKESKSSLFHVICESANYLPPLADDFNIFLKECCRWKEDTDENGHELPGYTSPKIFFRTLGIYSMQNAIDFACDIRANPNKTYTSLLDSYPVGAQLLIQQCMKKLTGNEAYAYVGRVVENTRNQTAKPDDEQVDSDDEKTNTETLADLMLKVEHNVLANLFHSEWKVSFPDVIGSESEERGSEFGKILLTEYKKEVVCWRWTVVDYDSYQNKDNDEDASEALSKILTDYIKNVRLVDLGQSLNKNIQVPSRLFRRNVNYIITCVPDEEDMQQKYSCSVKFPELLNVSLETRVTDQKGTKYHEKWITGENETDKKETRITFELMDANYDDVMRSQFRNLFERYAKNFKDWVWQGAGTTYGDLEKARLSMMQKVNDGNAASAAQAGGNEPENVDDVEQENGDDVARQAMVDQLRASGLFQDVLGQENEAS